MKPIHLNLAARPYRDYRPVYAVVVLMSLVTAFLMLNNVETWYRYKHDTRSTSGKIDTIDAKIRDERQKQEIAQRRLRNLDLATLDAQTRFINAKLSERAFSWSTLLDELESILPQDVRLMTVGPTFNPDGTIQLALDLEAKSSTGMITTINRMNADPQFGNPFPDQETMVEGGLYRFNLRVQYLPPAAKPAIVRTGK
ncbi:MAG TPA: hypothetical protein VKB93_14625 [Thermoanaerobaculia bacterium]|nr:hypothetical protein [Thermoanaerobaculia bacterium]